MMANRGQNGQADRAHVGNERRNRTQMRCSFGIDVSSQSITGVLLDIETGEKLWERSLDFREDPRLVGFGVGPGYLVPPRVEGEADQPPLVYLAGLDAMFKDLADQAPDLIARIVVINVSGQQHGHVYLNKHGEHAMRRLQKGGRANDSALSKRLDGIFSYRTAPIWMTSNTTKQAAEIRAAVGGKAKMIELSGSDSPLRFSGAVIRRVGQQFPEAYEQTSTIHLISSFIPAVLTGDINVPVDFGNGCGMSLMDYAGREWSKELRRAVSDGLPGGERALERKLPKLAAPHRIVGNIAAYFVESYGLSNTCMIATGSGDNPQAKVLVPGDLLSLGTSFVYMVANESIRTDGAGLANAMYDGVGRPFLFACRSNGTLPWDEVRKKYGLKDKEFKPAEDAIRDRELGGPVVLWQPQVESFPPSGSFELRRNPLETEPGLGVDYAGVIESSLAALWYYSQSFAPSTQEPLYVTGGASESPGVMRRVAAIWQRDVIAIDKAGPALGAALAGAHAYCRKHGETFDVEAIGRTLLQRQDTADKIGKTSKNDSDVEATHRPGGYIDTFLDAYEQVTKPE